MDPQTPPSEAIRLELTRILVSPGFSGSPRLREFLQFITEEALAGRAAQLKEYAVGTAVYRKGMSYDPRLDSTVRVEAAKLRSRLDRYYATSGQNDAVCISMPKGSYVPRFEMKSAEHSPASGEPASPPSIAVLPFLNLSSDPENEYFSDGLAEEITAALTRSNAMRVAPRTAAFRFKGPHADLREVGRALNVDRALEGSVRKSGDRLRITVQLVDLAGCRQLWSNTYDRTFCDILAIQEDIACQVVSVLCCRNGPTLRIPRYTSSPEAFDLYLRGQHLLYRWESTAEGRAIEFFEQALAADPQYPLPYVGVAAALDCLSTMGFASPASVLPKAKRAVERALELDAGLAEAHIVRATLIARHDWDWAAAETEYRLAIELCPGLAQAHHEYALEFLAPNGRFTEAHAAIRRARELDPFSPSVAYGHPWILIWERRFRESESEFRRLLVNGAVYEGERVGLSFALLGQGRYRESLDEYTRIVAKDRSPANECIQAWLLALAGECNEARRRLEAIEADCGSRYAPLSYLAAVHFAFGELDRGFELLDRAIEQKEPPMRSLKEGFDWDPIRSDPRFSVLLRKLWPAI